MLGSFPFYIAISAGALLIDLLFTFVFLAVMMDLAPEDLRHRLHQLRFLANETDDPLAERLVQDLIVELEDRLTAVPSPVKNSLG